ncbi:MAG: ABC transporter ATP-binding protein [Magnetovibrio sp.]|nr:ABC transporter ATP-binding protein [Magnetovibrio sp.]|tara:strand:- start:235 stop:1011 length:777 start_codon:yes stop_codon:yes gene_type:complete
MNNVLEISNLSKNFGGINAVNNVSFNLKDGELLALIGPNGAGKSTCFNMIMGQILPNQGKIQFMGENLVGRPTREIWRKGIGRTFQITATYPSMTVIENVQIALLSFHNRLFSFFKKTKNQFQDKAESLLELVGMLAQADRPAAVLAYGDLKRLELAIALSNEPRLLLMDEPTAGMAPKARIELMALTSKIVATKSVSVLFTEHDMDIVFTHAHRLIVLNRGELIAGGTVEEIRNNQRVQEVYLGGGNTFELERRSNA